MPSVEFDLGDLAHLMGARIDVGEFREVVPMLGVAMESIDEEKIILEVFPNRPDMLSIEGFARAIKGFIGSETAMKKYPIQDSGFRQCRTVSG